MNNRDSGSNLKYLMCPPEHYTIAYEPSPWARVERAVDRKRAEAQWRGLYDWLTAKALVELMEPIKGLTDLVFTAKSGLMSQGCFIKSRFRQRARRSEEIEIERWFRKKTTRSKQCRSPILLKGREICLR